MSVNILKICSRIALPMVAVGTLLMTMIGLSEPQGATYPPDAFVDFLCGAALTLLAFTGFPDSRRSDLVIAPLSFALMLALAAWLCGRGNQLADCASLAGGAVMVFACSCLERLRSLERSNPHAPLSFAYPADRRSLGPLTLRSVRRRRGELRPLQLGS